MSVKEKMTAIADAIREKTGGTEALTLDAMTAEIAGIETGGDYTDEQMIALLNHTISEFTFPEGITNIGSYAFYLCSNLTMTGIPETVTYIGERAFYGANKVQIRYIPDSVTSLGRYCFSSPLITEISIPGGVTTNQGSFYCTNLTTATFRGTPKKLDTSTFFQCNNLTEINVPWAEGEVANAPWGATNATIHYESVPTQWEG